MTQYINKAAVVAEIEKRIENCAKQREDMLNVQCNTLADNAFSRMGELNCIINFLDTLEVKKVESDKERNEREHQYWESAQAYWNYVLRTIDNKRVLPTFKGQLLHDFKNELHTMKQLVGLINHPEIPEGLFDKLALVFAAWGGYHFHPTKTETEDTLEVKEVNLEKEMYNYFDEHDREFFEEDYLDYAKHFYELGIKAKKGE